MTGGERGPDPGDETPRHHHRGGQKARPGQDDPIRRANRVPVRHRPRPYGLQLLHQVRHRRDLQRDAQASHE